MSLLNRNKKKMLFGPNFESAPLREIQLSGTSVKFRNPVQTVSDIHGSFPRQWNIYDDEQFEEWSSKKGMTATLYKNGWYFYGGMFARNRGALHVQLIVQRRSFSSNQKSLFFRNQLNNWIFLLTGGFCKKFNEDILKDRKEDCVDFNEEQIKEKYFFRYPVCESDISLKSYNGSCWRHYEIFQPGFSKDRYYCLPISDNHVFTVVFVSSAINCRYFDPRHNLDEAVEETIEMFMNNMHVTLSPDAQQCFDAVSKEKIEFL